MPQALNAMQLAIREYQAGNWPQAERLCAKVLESQPDHFDALNLSGVIAVRQQQPQRAVQMLSQAARVAPNRTDTLSNLGGILQGLGRHDEALKAYEAALNINAGDAALHIRRGDTLVALQRSEDALRSYDCALQAQPNHVLALHNRGNVLRVLLRFEAAQESYKRVLAINPDDAQTLTNLGNLLCDVLRFDEALEYYDRTLRLTPDDAKALNNRATALSRLQRHAEALQDCERALALNPGLAHALCNRGAILLGMGHAEKALESCERALAVAPNYVNALVARGKALCELNRAAAALHSLDRAIAIEPQSSDAHCGRGVALQALARYPEAVQSMELAVRYGPANAEARLNQALFLLARGDFARGWDEYEWRWQTPEFLDRRIKTNVPEWTGQRLRGTLLVWNEQGLGDEVFFAGMLHELQSRVPSVTVCVDQRLVALFKRSFANLPVHSAQTVRPDSSFEAHIAAGSLGRYLRRDFDTVVKTARPYLKACPERTRELRAAIARNGRLTCGLSWLSKNPKIGGSKSLRLMDLLPILELPGIDFVDLQYGDTVAEQTELGAAAGVKLVHANAVDNFSDIDGLASLMDACDVILTVSNTTAHLAGALGKPVLLMLPLARGALWYWHADRNDSPWYPKVNIFRQHKLGAWREVVASVAEELHLMTCNIE